MSPFLVFLNAARNLAGMGMKREQVLDFAKREFGELTELMKSQIDNIYRPKKSVSPKDPDFDDTVVKMKFDDEGKPFNPKDPLKNLSKKDKKADGGRIGLRIGSGEGFDVSGREYSAPSAAARSVSTSPSRDDSPSNNFRDTTTKKQLLDTMVKGGKNLAINKAIEKSKFGKFLGPKGAALFGIINALRGDTKKSPPGNLSMLDEEGIGGLPENQFAELSQTQLDFLNSPKIQRDLKEFGREPKAIFDQLPKYEERRPTLFNPLKKQESTTPQEFNEYLDSIGVKRMTAADGGRIGLKNGISLESILEGRIPPVKMPDPLQEILKKMTPEEKEMFKIRMEIMRRGFEINPPENPEGVKPVPMPTYPREDRADGGRIGLKDGMDRRKFLKIMGGLASIPVLGKFFKGAKVASTAVPAVKEAVTKAPSYFFRLVDKIRRFGKIIDDSVADPRVERTYKYKDYELKEGAFGDPSETIITKKTDMGPYGYKEEQMRFKKGGQTEDGFVADEYEELTARPDMEGKLKDIEEGIDDASEIIEEATKSAPPIKKAAGGLAYMLGE